MAHEAGNAPGRALIRRPGDSAERAQRSDPGRPASPAALRAASIAVLCAGWFVACGVPAAATNVDAPRGAAPAQPLPPSTDAREAPALRLPTDGSAPPAPGADLDALAAELAALRARSDRPVTDAEPATVEATRRATSRLITLIAARIDTLRLPPPEVRIPEPPLLPGDPPHAVADLDRLRDQLDSLSSQRAALRPLAAAVDAGLEQAAAQHRRAAESLRLRQEQLERARGEVDTGRARSLLHVARLEQRVAELELARADDARRAIRARLGALDGPIARLAAAIDAARGAQRIDDTDLAAVREQSDAERVRIAAERTALIAAIAALEPAGAADATAARTLRTLNDTAALLGELDTVEASRVHVWSQRHAALASDTPASIEALRRSVAQARAHERAVGERIGLLRTEERLQRSRLEALATDAPGRAAEAHAAAALVRLLDLQEQLRATLQRYATLLERSLGDALARDGAAPERGGLQRLAHAAIDLVRQAWRFELFSATDTVLVDGRTVTVDYGVTVGKSLGAVLLFLAGWAIAARLSRRLVAMLVARGVASEALGRVLHRWTMTVLLVAVLLVVLRLARVPLTAFAFLGGAIAIGIGFGTQNLIKNLISGVIILFERKIRVGDVVTIDGVSGTVVAVDLRATTVRGFDGIDAILPNSRLLETTVADWSHGDRRIRHTLRVPVAVGSDTDAVAAALCGCARAHPAVLAEPAPEALFDDVRPEALVFALQYWIRLDGPRAGPQVASDLRFAIDHALRHRGVEPARARVEVAVG